MRSVLLCLLLITAGLFMPPAQAQTQPDPFTLKVGVRTDATSMSYQIASGTGAGTDGLLGPLRSQGYAGYVVYICDRALIELQRYYGRQLKILAVPLRAHERFEALEQGRVDIMCGPTTATRDRLAGRTSSAPVFVSGVTYASRPETGRSKCASIVGYLKGSTSGHGSIVKILDAGEWAQDRDLVQQFIDGNSSWEAVYDGCPASKDGTPAPAPLREFETHTDLAKAFCADAVHYYVGDFEIVTRTLLTMKDCYFNVSDQMFSEERYVILGTARPDDQSVNPYVTMFFEMLSHQIFFEPSVLDEAFADTFQFSTPSRKLTLLYWAMRGNK